MSAPTEDPIATATQPEVANVDARTVGLATGEDTNALGPLAQLPGVWAKVGSHDNTLVGRGWNMIALPFGGADEVPFRLLLNQFNERLEFSLVDKNIPNRGVDQLTHTEADESIAALDYEQSIMQIAAGDFPQTPLAGQPGAAIHHEPGLFLHMPEQDSTQTTEPDSFNIGRLAKIPHGDSVLALGTSSVTAGMPDIDPVDPLPVGVPHDLTDPYLAPYVHFHNVNQGDNKNFRGALDPTDPVALLEQSNTNVNITSTTTLTMSTVNQGGITNIPLVTKQANATEMHATFWIQQLEDTDLFGRPRLRLQYLQVVFLEFLPRTDGVPGLIRWPHISFNTMEKISDTPDPGYGALKLF